MLPPGTYLRRCGRRGRRRRPSTRCALGGSLHRGAHLRRRYVRARRSRRPQPIRWVRARAAGHRTLHRSGLLRRRVSCGHGCGLLVSGAGLLGLLGVQGVGCELLVSGAVLLGLLVLAGRRGRVRVQCEILVFRTSDLESHPELVGGGERAASERTRVQLNAKESRGARCTDSGDSIARWVLYLLAHYFTVSAREFLRHAPAHLLARLRGHVEEYHDRVGVAEAVLEPQAHVGWVAEAHVAEAEQREQQHEQGPGRAVH